MTSLGRRIGLAATPIVSGAAAASVLHAGSEAFAREAGLGPYGLAPQLLGGAAAVSLALLAGRVVAAEPQGRGRLQDLPAPARLLTALALCLAGIHGLVVRPIGAFLGRLAAGGPLPVPGAAGEATGSLLLSAPALGAVTLLWAARPARGARLLGLLLAGAAAGIGLDALGWTAITAGYPILPSALLLLVGLRSLRRRRRRRRRSPIPPPSTPPAEPRLSTEGQSAQALLLAATAASLAILCLALYRLVVLTAGREGVAPLFAFFLLAGAGAGSLSAHAAALRRERRGVRRALGFYVAVAGALGLVAVTLGDDMPQAYLDTLARIGTSRGGELAGLAVLCAMSIGGVAIASGAAAGTLAERRSSGAYLALAILCGGAATLAAPALVGLLGIRNVLLIASSILVVAAGLSALLAEGPLWRRALRGTALMSVGVALLFTAGRWDLRSFLVAPAQHPGTYGGGAAGVVTSRIGRDRIVLYLDGPRASAGLGLIDGEVPSAFLEGRSRALSLPGASAGLELPAHLPALLDHHPAKVLALAPLMETTFAALESHGAPQVSILAPDAATARLFLLSASSLDPSIDRPAGGAPRILEGTPLRGLARAPVAADLILMPPLVVPEAIADLLDPAFLARVRRHLAPSGMVLAAIPVDGLDVAAVRAAVGSFDAAFPRGSAWITRTDILLAGSPAGIEPNVGSLDAAAGAPDLSDALAALGLDDPLKILARQVDPARLAQGEIPAGTAAEPARAGGAGPGADAAGSARAGGGGGGTEVAANDRAGVDAAGARRTGGDVGSAEIAARDRGVDAAGSARAGGGGGGTEVAANDRAGVDAAGARRTGGDVGSAEIAARDRGVDAAGSARAGSGGGGTEVAANDRAVADVEAPGRTGGDGKRSKAAVTGRAGVDAVGTGPTGGDVGSAEIAVKDRAGAGAEGPEAAAMEFGGANPAGAGRTGGGGGGAEITALGRAGTDAAAPVGADRYSGADAEIPGGSGGDGKRPRTAAMDRAGMDAAGPARAGGNGGSAKIAVKDRAGADAAGSARAGRTAGAGEDRGSTPAMDSAAGGGLDEARASQGEPAIARGAEPARAGVNGGSVEVAAMDRAGADAEGSAHAGGGRGSPEAAAKDRAAVDGARPARATGDPTTAAGTDAAAAPAPPPVDRAAFRAAILAGAAHARLDPQGPAVMEWLMTVHAAAPGSFTFPERYSQSAREAVARRLTVLREVVRQDLRGWLALDRRDGDALREAASEALRLDPSDHDARVLLARGLVMRADAELKAGDPDAARSDDVEALGLDPEALDALASLAWIRRAAGERKAAESLLERAARIAPWIAQTRYRLGLLHYEGGDLDGAEAALDEAHRLDPHQPEPLIVMGDIARLRGQTDRARQIYQLALATGSRTVEVQSALAALRLEEGKPHEALDEVEKALARKPGDPEALMTRARIRLRLGQADKARHDVLAAVTTGGAPYRARALLETSLRDLLLQNEEIPPAP